MTSQIKRLIHSCIALSVALVCLVLSFCTFGWFSSNREVTAKGFAVSARTEFGAYLNVHPVTAISGNTYTFATDVIATELPKYDKYGIDAIQYEKALVLELTFVSESDYIDFSVSASGSFSASGWENPQALSNVVSFYPVTAAEENRVTVSTTEYSFVSVQNVDGNDTIVRGESSTLALLSNHNVAGDGTEHRLYVVVTYNEAAAEYYCSRTDSNVNFENDITFNIEKSEAAV
ncbi:MAG: hypothetical protein ACI4S9_06295 [Christensenellales bacterium]